MASHSQYAATAYRALYASKCRVPGELTLPELQRVLTDLGFCDSVHSRADATEYIYKYDSSLRGVLGTSPTSTHSGQRLPVRAHRSGELLIGCRLEQ